MQHVCTALGAERRDKVNELRMCHTLFFLGVAGSGGACESTTDSGRGSAMHCDL